MVSHVTQFRNFNLFVCLIYCFFVSFRWKSDNIKNKLKKGTKGAVRYHPWQYTDQKIKMEAHNVGKSENYLNKKHGKSLRKRESNREENKRQRQLYFHCWPSKM